MGCRSSGGLPGQLLKNHKGSGRQQRTGRGQEKSIAIRFLEND